MLSTGSRRLAADHAQTTSVAVSNAVTTTRLPAMMIASCPPGNDHDTNDAVVRGEEGPGQAALLYIGSRRSRHRSNRGSCRSLVDWGPRNDDCACPNGCDPKSASRPSGPSHDHRGSPIPTGAMIATRFMELRKRR